MKEIFASAGYGLIALVGFVAAFVAIAVWAYRPKNKQQLEQHATIPLREDHHG